MGLDMYLSVKTNDKNKVVGKTDHTGACGGLMPFTIANKNGEQEIGYWRKQYRLADRLTMMLYGDDDEGDNLVPKEMTIEDIKDIIEFAKEQLKEDAYNSNVWDYTIKVFKKALQLAKQGDTVIYEQWY